MKKLLLSLVLVTFTGFAQAEPNFQIVGGNSFSSPPRVAQQKSYGAGVVQGYYNGLPIMSAPPSNAVSPASFGALAGQPYIDVSVPIAPVTTYVPQTQYVPQTTWGAVGPPSYSYPAPAQSYSAPAQTYYWQYPATSYSYPAQSWSYSTQTYRSPGLFRPARQTTTTQSYSAPSCPT